MLIIAIDYENKCSFSVNVPDCNTENAKDIVLQTLEEQLGVDPFSIEDILIVEAGNVVNQITYPYDQDKLHNLKVVPE